MTASPEPSAYLGATDVIDCDSPVIQDLSEQIVAPGAAAAVAAGAMFAWVRDEIGYNMGPRLRGRDDWMASATATRSYGFCQQKALLLAALLRSRGIPAGIGVEILLDHKIPPHFVEYMGSQEIPLHGYTVAFVDGYWQRIDATLDATLCQRKNYRLVEYSPGLDALLPATDLSGRPHFDHLRHVGHWPDLPAHIVESTLALSYLHDEDFLQMATHHGPEI